MRVLLTVCKAFTRYRDACTSGPSMYEVGTPRYSTRLTGPKRPHWRILTAGARPLVQGPPKGLNERRRQHAASARARVAVPALAAGLFLHHHEDAYQCVRTCLGATGMG